LANWNKNGIVNGTVVAGLAAVPSLTGGGGYAGPISYASSIAADQKSCTGKMYIFEASKATVHADPNAPFLTVKGEFDGIDGWYRIDFADNSTMNYLDVLRNHLYSIGIDRVTGTGFPSEEEAMNNQGDNIIVDITIWNEYDLGGIWFGGQHFLAISPQDISYSEEEHTDQTLTIRTDNNLTMTLGNIRLSGSSFNPNAGLAGNWISNLAFSYKGVENGNNVYTLTYDVEQNDTIPRTGYIYVTHGRITGVVRIAQSEGGATTIAVDPTNIVLGYHAQAPADRTLKVSCLKDDGTHNPKATWTLSVPTTQSWLRLSLNSNATFATASTTISGTGSQTVYVYVEENSTHVVRSEEYFLNGEKAGQIYQACNYNDFPDVNTTPSGFVTYVGAFWRSNQTGERIIRIEAGANSANYGDWTASIVWMDQRWGYQDGIILSLDNLPGTAGADPDIYTNNPGDAENYKVEGDKMSVNGNVSSTNKYITFRIGLKSNYIPDSDHPVRYAVLLLSYANHTKNQDIYLRQGEEADYLFCNTDKVIQGDVIQRTVTARFSPYNLTANNMNTAVDKQGTVPAVNPGKFTEYPSQSGGFFQWAHSNLPASDPLSRRRWIWDPYSPSVSGWQTFPLTTSTYCSTLEAEHETCPPGYHRPRDGSITTSVSGNNISDSELRQTLFKSPQTGFNFSSDLSNCVMGYYADGFFDRRPISSTGMSVAGGTKNVADFGRLFYNPLPGSCHYGASIFFPAGGNRYFQDGTLMGVASTNNFNSYYWTASASMGGSNYYGIMLRIFESHAGIWRSEKPSGAMIRCVKE